MKKVLYFSLVFLSSTPVWGMRWAANLTADQLERAMRAAGELAGDAFSEAQRIAEHRAEEREKKKLEELQRLQARLDGVGTDLERQHYLNQIAEVDSAARRQEDRWDNFAAEAAGIPTRLFGIGTDMARAEQAAGHRLQEVAVQADMQRQGAVERTREYIAALTNPRNVKIGVAALTGTALGIYAAKHGTALIADIIKKRYGLPKLAQDTSLIPLYEQVTNKLAGRKPLKIAPKTPAEIAQLVKQEIQDLEKIGTIVSPERKAQLLEQRRNQELKRFVQEALQRVVFEPELKRQIDEIAIGLWKKVQNGAYLENILFYGPPGTGKTLVAKELARLSGFEYIYFAASSLDQFSIEEATAQLTRLFDFAKNSGHKLMIIIDEAELLFADRQKQKEEVSEKMRKLLTHILTYTGTETRDYMVVALTNRPQDLDSAFLSRCGNQVEVGLPGFEQRCALLNQYLGEFVVKAAKPLPQLSKLDKVRNWLINKQVRQAPLILQPGVINDAYIASIAQKVESFTGRDIMKLALAIQQAAYSNDDRVTVDLIDKIVQLKIQQKQKEREGFTLYNQNRSAAAGQQQNIEELRKLFARQSLGNRS